MRGDDLEKSMHNKDVIINCLRYNSETEGMINKDSLQAFT
jgi:phosphoglycerate dehydrogenase-like enzyme